MQARYLAMLGLAVAGLGVVNTGCAGTTDTPDQANSARRIYLDPATGNVMSAPPKATGTPSSAQRVRRDANEPDTPYHAWQTKDGVQMLSVDPHRAPAERVVRCADGRLEMGVDTDDTGRCRPAKR